MLFFPLILVLFMIPRIHALPHDITASAGADSKSQIADRMVILGLIFGLLMYLVIHLVIVVVSHHGFSVKLTRSGSLLPRLTFSSWRRSIGRIVPPFVRRQAASDLPISMQVVPSPMPSTGIHGDPTPLYAHTDSVNGTHMSNASQHSLAPSETPTLVPPLLS
ncbi:hypothetical protein MVEN_02446400 [Mycena venus]|uniref:Uncharacterized protein n=1 Tax=Mycena venus TaxID=2733690 RepID=A0A8H7CBS1_9AGAR|nr:hypothetical protein MVEN_02446400 [Mycena venus]